MANVGLPGTSGFVGEFMVILASYKANFWIALTAALTLIVGAAYTLWMVKRVIFGEVRHAEVSQMPDLNAREVVIMSSLAFFVILLGVWPDPLANVMHATIDNLVQHIAQSKL
jgi:NADH-quinone oxidoreductase subunit M